MMINIYLDVDGVINALARSFPKEQTGWLGEWYSSRINCFIISWSEELINELNSISEFKNVTFKWLTTWEDEAKKAISPNVGIHGEEWEYLLDADGTKFTYSHTWWKLKAIKKDIEESKPEGFIWLDDDIKADPEALKWLKEQDNCLIISPETTYGLTKQNINDIIDFIKE